MPNFGKNIAELDCRTLYYSVACLEGGGGGRLGRRRKGSPPPPPPKVPGFTYGTVLGRESSIVVNVCARVFVGCGYVCSLWSFFLHVFFFVSCERIIVSVVHVCVCQNPCQPCNSQLVNTYIYIYTVVFLWGCTTVSETTKGLPGKATPIQYTSSPLHA